MPVEILLPESVHFTQFSTGISPSCALDDNNKAYCWGSNRSGRVGNGSTDDTLIPTEVTLPEGVIFTQISTGWSFSCALGNNGKIYFWGGNRYGALGNGNDSIRSSSAPVEVLLPDGVHFTQLFMKFSHICAFGNDGKTYCWGRNFYGQLGNGTTEDSSIPLEVLLPEGVSFTELSLALYKTCELGDDRKTYCWGQILPNTMGALYPTEVKQKLEQSI